jgi:hypothetical protein
VPAAKACVREEARTEQRLACFFAKGVLIVERSRRCVGTMRGAKNMTACSPNDSAGEHNNGSGCTAAC